MMPFEENILRMLEICPSVQMPEISDWNPVGITEEEAEVIAHRNGLELKILESRWLPTFRGFIFKTSTSHR